MDAATLSAFAAAAAAIAAATVAGIQLYVGYRQSKAELIAARAAMMNAESAGRHTVAAFRQKWIETVRDTLSEYQSILMALRDNEAPAPDDERKLNALEMKIGLLLNPNEIDSRQLLIRVGELRYWADSVIERHQVESLLSPLAQRILKTEWDRIKDELKEREPSRT